jgi:PadR family transcriptional regulator
VPRRKPRLQTLPAKQALVLELLVGGQEMYGLELVAASNGRLKRGTVYVTLGRMERRGLIASRLDDAPAKARGLPRRLYHATVLGRRVLDAWSHLARLLPEFAP